MEIVQVLGVANLIFTAATFAVALKIFYKMEHGESENKELVEVDDPPQPIQAAYEIPEKAIPKEKRKPIVMDDERAYRLEIDDLATRGKTKS